MKRFLTNLLLKCWAATVKASRSAYVMIGLAHILFGLIFLIRPHIDQLFVLYNLFGQAMPLVTWGIVLITIGGLVLAFGRNTVGGIVVHVISGLIITMIETLMTFGLGLVPTVAAYIVLGSFSFIAAAFHVYDLTRASKRIERASEHPSAFLYRWKPLRRLLGLHWRDEFRHA